MQIKFDSGFNRSLLLILDYIATDKLSAAVKFKKELQKKISLLSDSPYMFIKSKYFEDESYRDMVYKGYTIIYKVTENEIMVLEIFKWTDR